MTTGRRFMLLTAGLLLLYSLAIMINAAVNFRNFSLQNTEQKADLTAIIVREGLTTMMVTGTIDQRDLFLDAIRSPQAIKNLWVIRSQKVIDQFGPGRNGEKPHDAIDRLVLASGKPVKTFNEDADRATFRITIPYTATSTGSKNCLACHHVKEGDVLGAISIEFDITDTRVMGLWTLIRIGLITLVFLLVAIYAVRRLSRPYMTFFQELQGSLAQVKGGDFNHRIACESANGDLARSADMYNLLIEKFQNTIGNVEEKLSTLLQHGQHDERLDPLEKAAATIDTLAKIQRFKRTIEQDATLEQIYAHLGDVVRLELGAERYLFYADNLRTNTRDILLSTLSTMPCRESTRHDVSACRAIRTHATVESDQFPNLCPLYAGPTPHYLCIPFDMGEYILTTVILAEDEKELKRFKRRLPIFKNHLETAKPVIQGRLLTRKLKEKSLKDGLTGVYNRKFLEELIEKIDNQSKRELTPYAVMMIDIDRFKSINDTYGHNVGDVVIKKLTRTIQENIRSADIVARYGGEEFVVLLHRSEHNGGIRVARQIQKSFGSEPVTIGETTLRSTVSIGLACYPEHADSIREAIHLADLALYKAKRDGRNRIVIYDPKKMSQESGQKGNAPK